MTEPAGSKASSGTGGRRAARVAVGLALGVGLAFGGAMAYLELGPGAHVRNETAAFGERLRGLGAAVDEDLRSLAAAPPFALPGTARDAGAFLNARVGWSGAKPPIDAFRAAHPAALLIAPAPLIARLKGYGDRWPEHADDPDLAAVDTSFLRGLLEYDHWDWERGSPSELDGSIGGSAPWPELGNLVTLAKIRLLQGLANGDSAQAGREVRQLARLMYSTESLVGASMSALVLGMERAAYDRLVATKGAAAAEGWTAVSPDAQRRFARVGWAMASLFHPLAPQVEADHALRADPASFGRCAGLSQAAGGAIYARPLFDDGTLRARFSALDEALRSSASSCRLRRVREAAAAGANAKGALRGSLDELCEGQGAFCRVLYRLPGARAKAGQILLLIGATAPSGY